MTKMLNISTNKYYVYAVILTAQFGIFLSGVYYSWASPILVKLANLDDNPLERIITPTEQVWIVTIGVSGMWIGCSLSGELYKKIGRRPSLILMTFPSLVSFVMLAFAKHIWVILLARILGAITNGGMFTLLPIYFGEIADPKSRSILGTAFNLFLNVGLLFSLSIGPYIPYKLFNIILAVCVLIYTLLITLVIPESPYYLVEKNPQLAEETLKNIRQVDDVKSELKQIQQYVELEAGQNGSYSEMLSSRTARKSLLMGIGVACFQQTSGISVIMDFGQLIFEEVDGFLPSGLSLIILGFSQVIFGLIAPIFTNMFGRRSLLVSSYSGIAISLVTFSLYFVLKLENFSVDGICWLPLLSMTVYMFSFGIGAGAVTFIVLGEISPSRLKGKTTSVANILASMTGLLLANAYTFFNVRIGIGYTFWILGSLNILAAIFARFYVIETKGKSLKDIQLLLNKSRAPKEQSIGL